MQHSRMGVILIGAAIMDDVVGLVMVNIVTTLGGGDVGAWPIARPIVASFGLLLISLAIGAFVLKPLRIYFEVAVNVSTGSKFDIKGTAIKASREIPHIGFLLSTLVSIAFITIASFIDASVLFGVFIAGGLVSYLWDVGKHNVEEGSESNSAHRMYEEYYKSAMDCILVPFFFASIGFSIPITDLFEISIVWRGIVYSMLMIIAKGLVSLVIYLEYFIKSWHRSKETQVGRMACQASGPLAAETTRPPHVEALLVGFAMVARGEIGFLIASLSQSSGTLSLNNRQIIAVGSGEAVFLVVVWAIVICTITGPIAVGILVKRLRNQVLEPTRL
ncbi:hypothetical protein DSL72_004058 [Monilinia vaccinii-corymbosi]|uniref:Cation/H+ exchanger transmembrane domain-containing protein n=1 Tax=Monilinia vaccinii-corymbosi TaxID=61207 RepID=A0A8A3NVM5_9HELO|nr:hypothetical protein DSL72_004058 [Monilinia vaccinii-corymbosi]